jgi:putative adhesin
MTLNPSSRPSRPLRARRHSGAAIVIAAVLMTACTVEAQRVEGSFEKTLSVGPQTDIEIMSGSGSIEVRQGSAGRVEIRAKVRAGDWGWNRSGLSAQERVKRIEANPPVEQQGNTVSIGEIKDTDLRDGVSISYDVTVPPGTALRSKTGSGSQRIEGVDGNVVASTGSGSVNIRRSGGRVRASTGSGGITAEDVGGAFEASTGSGSIDGMGVKGPVTVRTSSGSIEVTQTAGGDVEASSSSGSVRVRGVQGGVRASTTSGSLAIEGQMEREWRLSSSSGHVTVSVPASQGFELDASSSSGRINTDFPITVSGTIGKHALRGSARGGGPLLHVRTSSGGISIQ